MIRLCRRSFKTTLIIEMSKSSLFGTKNTHEMQIMSCSLIGSRRHLMFVLRCWCHTLQFVASTLRILQNSQIYVACRQQCAQEYKRRGRTSIARLAELSSPLSTFATSAGVSRLWFWLSTLAAAAATPAFIPCLGAAGHGALSGRIPWLRLGTHGHCHRPSAVQTDVGWLDRSESRV